MKRALSAFLAVLMLFGIGGCRKEPAASTQPSQSTPQLTTQTTTLPTTVPTIIPEPTTLPTTVPAIETTLPTLPAATSATNPSTKPTETKPVQSESGASSIPKASFVRVKDYIPDIEVGLRYAGTDNFMGKAIYDFTDAYLRYGTVKKLMKVQSALAEYGLRLKIWDAYRPGNAQHIMWHYCQNETYIDNPAVRYSSHTMGDTVDITLVDAAGNEVPMPSDYDVFSKQGDRDYSDCTEEQKKNAQLLEKLMESNGFFGYDEEWWHFSDSASYSTNLYFDPAVISVWYANCSTYLSLRKTPYLEGTEIDRIKPGESVILLGWYEKFAFVDYQGTQGYVSSSYLKPESEWIPNDILTIVRETDVYTYEQLHKDIAALQAKYPTLLQVSSIGKSELGRELTLLIVGDPNAAHHVIIQAAIHGREHMTTWTVMAMTEYWLSQNMAGMENTCFHIVPMFNPDGVYLAQTGDYTAEQLEIYKRDKRKGNTNLSQEEYAANWKANGLGIDLNRNFDAAWKVTFSRAEPSSERYKGTAPNSAAETAALSRYTLEVMPDVTISIHSTGSFMYYQYGNKVGVNDATESLALAIKGVSGYMLMDSSGVDAGGYKDWCMDSLEIPSLTIEIGCDFCPLAKRELYSVFIRNLRMMPTISQWIEMQK